MESDRGFKIVCIILVAGSRGVLQPKFPTPERLLGKTTSIFLVFRKVLAYCSMLYYLI